MARSARRVGALWQIKRRAPHHLVLPARSLRDRPSQNGEGEGIVETPRTAYLVRRRVLLRLTSKTTYPSDLNSLYGICPCPGSRAWAYGAHLATQVERI